MTVQTISDKISTIATAMSIFSVGGMLVDLFVYIYLILLLANKNYNGSVSQQTTSKIEKNLRNKKRL